jgi:hypothetical protein
MKITSLDKLLFQEITNQKHDLMGISPNSAVSALSHALSHPPKEGWLKSNYVCIVSEISPPKA